MKNINYLHIFNCSVQQLYLFSLVLIMTRSDQPFLILHTAYHVQING